MLSDAVDKAGDVQDGARAGRTARDLRAADHAGNAPQVAKVAANAVDDYRKDERGKNLASNERNRILNEYDRLVRKALRVPDKCLKEKPIWDLQENMEYQLNNVTTPSMSITCLIRPKFSETVWPRSSWLHRACSRVMTRMYPTVIMSHGDLLELHRSLVLN